jgi:hypothetical protein
VEYNGRPAHDAQTTGFLLDNGTDNRIATLQHDSDSAHAACPQ